ncbi:transmembrane protein 265-like [Erpetoichthys calabaricus]|uniref:transmembrane protein 265-like n=1 Tax=Erpetoichthys calabaricus TaxID=27687 RepID=UPI0010A00F91|nr:transmembrane protein 265-like [Erpetoichthys calabaricus]XP_051790692.1 transmembrane protein 265-like [Erpetoichthys calabaricus]
MAHPNMGGHRDSKETTPLNGDEATPSVSRCHNDYRKLSIVSIICGLSCVGIMALINSVKAQEKRTSDPELAEQCALKARKFSILAILLWVAILVLVPTLMTLVSYLLTFID